MGLRIQGLENRYLDDRDFALGVHYHHRYEHSVVVSPFGISLERHSLLMEGALDDLPELGRAAHPELQIVALRRKPLVIVVERRVVVVEESPLLLLPMG